MNCPGDGKLVAVTAQWWVYNTKGPRTALQISPPLVISEIKQLHQLFCHLNIQVEGYEW